MVALTSEMAYKIGFWDAYFMGSVSTNQDGFSEELLAAYKAGYNKGNQDWARDNPLA